MKKIYECIYENSYMHSGGQLMTTVHKSNVQMVIHAFGRSNKWPSCCDIPERAPRSSLIYPSLFIITDGTTIAGIHLLHFACIFFSILLLFLITYIFNKPTHRSLSHYRRTWLRVSSIYLFFLLCYLVSITIGLCYCTPIRRTRLRSFLLTIGAKRNSECMYEWSYMHLVGQTNDRAKKK